MPSISTVWNPFIFRNWEGPVVYQEVDIIDLEAHSSRVILTYNHKCLITVFAHSLLHPTTNAICSLHPERRGKWPKWNFSSFLLVCYVCQLCAGVMCLFFVLPSSFAIFIVPDRKFVNYFGFRHDVKIWRLFNVQCADSYLITTAVSFLLAAYKSLNFKKLFK